MIINLVEEQYMNKWEYKTFTSTGGLRIAVEESAALSDDGWELITINCCNDYREWVFTYKNQRLNICIPIHIPISSLKVYLDSYCNNYQIYI